MVYILNNSSNNLVLSNSVIAYENNLSIGTYLYKNVIDKLILCEDNFSLSSITKIRAKYFFRTRHLKCFIVGLSNFLKHLNVGYSIQLSLVGLGFKVTRSTSQRRLFFELHFSHRLIYQIPNDIAVKCEKKKILIFGIRKSRVMDTAEELRNIRVPNIYKGKGIRYLNEVIRLKPGKQR